jgi:uncharacterized membrane protein YqhA
MKSHSSLNDSSQSYVDMLNLTSVKQFAKKLRSISSKQDQNKLTDESILRQIRKLKLPIVTISGVKFLAPYTIDKFIEEKTKCYGSTREEKSTISTARLRIVTKESKSEKLRDLVRKQKQKMSDEMLNKK